MFQNTVIKFAISFIVLIWTVLYSSASATPSKEKSIRFQHLTIEDGLPQNSVITSLQDRSGFMWFGTETGLARYDGYSFKVFKHEDNNSNSLSHTYITKIIEDSKGNLWIGTRGGGLNYFNTTTEQFSHYRYQADNINSLSHDFVYTLVEDYKGNLWIGTVGGGLNYFNTQTQQFTHYRHQEDDSTSLTNDLVLAIVEDKQQNLWVGTLNGFNYFDIKTHEFTQYQHKPNDLNSLSNNSVFTLVEDSNDNLWIGTSGAGLNYFNTKTKQFSHYRQQKNDPSSLSSDSIYSVFEDSQGNIWVGTAGGGLNYFNIQNKQFTQYRHQSNNPNSLSHDAVMSLSEDNQGNIWAGTLAGGLNYFNIKKAPFTHYRHHTNDINSLSHNTVFSFAEDNRGDLWIGTYGGGLNHFNAQNNQVTHYRYQANNVNSLNHDIVSKVITSKDGNLWIGTNQGVDYFNIKTKQFTHYEQQANNPNSLSHSLVLSMIEDSQGDLWIGTYSGVNHFDTQSKQFTHYRHNDTDSNSLSNDTVMAITEDRQGNLWFGTDKGLNHFNRETKQFTHYRHQANDPNSLSNDAVISITEDSHGTIWVGTHNGLNRFDSQSQQFTNYHQAHGLPDDLIYSIEEDNQGYIWVSTNNGLSRLEPETEIFRNYNVSDGLQSNEFSVGSSFKSDAGELFFGGVNGFNRFFPENIKEDKQPPKVVLTDMLLLNKSVPVVASTVQKANKLSNDKKSIFSLTNTLHETESILLSHQDNIIAFEFSTLHFNNTKKNRFAYKLVGWDKNWVNTDYKNRRATYTNLPHGDYTFKVKASNSDGYWNEEGATLQITVLPPPWQTWWAYTLYGLVLLMVIFAFIRSQKKKLIFVQKLNAQLESKVEKRTIELKLSNENLKKLSLTDQLTGLRNRRFIMNSLPNDIDLLLRKQKQNRLNKVQEKERDLDHIFFLIDLDHFKKVNDIHGHSAGDAVLIQTKVILESVFRESDYLVRWGGEEFLVIARFTDRKKAPELAERLRKAFEEYSFDLGDDHFINITCSIGYTSFPFLTGQATQLEWQRVIDIADHCLYAAKNSYRNAWVGLNNIDCYGENIVAKITHNTQGLIDLKKLSVESSVFDKKFIKWN